MANPNWKLQLLRAMLIVSVGFWVFAPVAHGDWLWDDDIYILNNPLLRHLPGLVKIWFEPTSFIEYYPVLTSVQWVQWHLWHTDTLGYHLTNIVLHILSALLVWRLLDKFGLRLAWLGGLLFAIHPVQVESVAWIVELKNTLSLPPFLLAICFYLDYEEKKQARDYWLALGLFIVAMLIKITMAPFPLVILLYAWWKRGRIGLDDLKAIAPFFAVSLALGSAIIYLGALYQHHDSLQDTMTVSLGTMAQGGWLSRIALAGLSLAFYFFNCIWPVGLLPIYPKWPVDPPSLLQFLPWPVMIGGLCWLWTKRRGWGRHALLGVGFFLVMLFPFATVHWNYTWVMDHFLYIPIIGLIGLLVAGLEQAEERLSVSLRPLGAGIIAVTMALLALDSHVYAAQFLNQETLWTYTLKGNPNAWPAHNNLGNIFFVTGRVSEAIEQYQLTLLVNPASVEAHNNLGIALNLKGRKLEAIDQFEAALKINPRFAMSHVNMGNTLASIGRTAEAIDQYKQALKINPDYPGARSNLAKLQVLQIVAPGKANGDTEDFLKQ